MLAFPPSFWLMYWTAAAPVWWPRSAAEDSTSASGKSASMAELLVTTMIPLSWACLRAATEPLALRGEIRIASTFWLV